MQGAAAGGAWHWGDGARAAGCEGERRAVIRMPALACAATLKGVLCVLVLQTPNGPYFFASLPALPHSPGLPASDCLAA